MDNISRWRAVAADMNLSAKALIRLEWMIFYKIVGKKMLTKQPNTLLLALRGLSTNIKFCKSCVIFGSPI